MESIASLPAWSPTENLLFACSLFAPDQADKLNKQNKQLENTPYHPYN
jgi:hypothetical protein